MSDARWAWLEIGCTVIVPVLVLSFGTSWLGPTPALLVGLAFPLGFAVASAVRDGRPSALSALSVASVLLTGGIGLLQLDPKWFAVKEAAVPALFGLGVAATAPTRFAMVRVLLDRLLDRARTAEALGRTGGAAAFDAAARRGTVELGLVTAASGAASWALAMWLVRSAPGTEAFTAELARYTGWSFGLVSLPTMAGSVVVLRRVLIRLEEAAGVPFDELVNRPAGP
jgi:hypothetical protein